MTARGASSLTSRAVIAWNGAWVERLTGRQTGQVVAGVALHAHHAYTDSPSGSVPHRHRRDRLRQQDVPRPPSDPRADGRVRRDADQETRPAQCAQEGHRGGQTPPPASHGKWLGVRRQLLGYKLDDRKIEQDAVMALAVAVDVAKETRAPSSDAVGFDYFSPVPGGVLSGAELIGTPEGRSEPLRSVTWPSQSHRPLLPFRPFWIWTRQSSSASPISRVADRARTNSTSCATSSIGGSSSGPIRVRSPPRVTAGTRCTTRHPI